MSLSVLITGAAGFLGRNFVRHHLQAGDTVVAVDDLSNPHSYWLEGNYERVEDDVSLVLAFWAVQHRRFDLAYHFAAPVGGREKIEGDPLFNADSLRLDSLFFRWAVSHVEGAVYPSSSAVYGTAYQGQGAVPLEEYMFDARSGIWPAPDEMYGFTKLAGERLALSAAAYGLNTLCIRPFSGYGEDQSFEYPVPSIAKRAADRMDPIDVWGGGDQQRDFVHVEDVVGATVARLQQPVTGYQTMNIGSGYPVSFNQVARMCADIVGYSPAIRNLMDKPVGVATRFCDTDRMHEFYTPTISLQEGLSRVLEAVAKR